MLGLFLMTIGIGFSIKADLGVSPVSSIPYTITLITGIDMGKSTIMFHIALILIQVFLLRKAFHPKNLGQIPVAIIFGYFTNFSLFLMQFIPAPESYILKLVFLLISIMFVAFGIFLYLPPNIIPLAGEGAMQAISSVTGISFPKAKISFDVTMVVVSATVCLLQLRNLGSVGLGTIISAILVGVVLNIIVRFMQKKLDCILCDTVVSYKS